MSRSILVLTRSLTAADAHTRQDKFDGVTAGYFTVNLKKKKMVLIHSSSSMHRFSEGVLWRTSAQEFKLGGKILSIGSQKL